MILLRYDPAIGQLVDAEGKPIGVVCVPVWSAHRYMSVFGAESTPDLSQATVKVPENLEVRPDMSIYERICNRAFNAALDAIK